MSKERNISGVQQFAIVNIPWNIDWEAMEITEDEEKRKFIDNFVENIKNKPLISYGPLNPNSETETTIGMIEDVYVQSLDEIDLFCSMWLVISPEYDLVSKNENMKEPLGLRLKPTAVCVQFDEKLNQTYIDASKLNAGLAVQMRKVLDPTFAKFSEKGETHE